MMVPGVVADTGSREAVWTADMARVVDVKFGPSGGWRKASEWMDVVQGGRGEDCRRGLTL